MCAAREPSSQGSVPLPRIPRRLYCSPRAMCLTSKPVIISLLWVLLLACILRSIQYTVTLAVPTIDEAGYEPETKLSFVYITFFYAFMAIVTASYPLGGFLADVYCGRYRVVTVSMGFVWMSLFLLVIAVIITVSLPLHDIPKAWNVFRNVLLGCAFIICIPGLSGFYSNVMQLSLDQLRDSPSHTLGIFLHWCVWVDLFGESIVHVVFTLFECHFGKHSDHQSNVIKNIGYYVPGVLFCALSVLMVVNCFTKRWFYTSDALYNPYKMVVDVLRYVRAHKYPTRRVAMHWTNGELPTRFDFAKDCYGGPFTSGQVEDVKTLGRVVLVLLSIGPVFVLSVPSSFFIFPLFSYHVSGRSISCTQEHVWIKSGTLGYVIGLVMLPLVIWVVYCVLKNRVPKILTRLEIGIVLSILGVFSMLVIDLVGHTISQDTTNSSHCMFLETYNLDKGQQPYYKLQLSWLVLIAPNCLTVISYAIVLVTTFEFISAQTPQPMKGLVFGILFAIKGSFNFLGAVSLVPFSLEFWDNLFQPYVTCGFGFFFLMLVVSLFGLVLFGCVSERYKYRIRDEEPFTQAIVEEIYERRLLHGSEDSYDDSMQDTRHSLTLWGNQDTNPPSENSNRHYDCLRPSSLAARVSVSATIEPASEPLACVQSRGSEPHLRCGGRWRTGMTEEDSIVPRVHHSMPIGASNTHKGDKLDTGQREAGADVRDEVRDRVAGADVTKDGVKDKETLLSESHGWYRYGTFSCPGDGNSDK